MGSDIKIPETFRPKKNLDDNIDYLLEESAKGYNLQTVEDLDFVGEQFIKENNHSVIDTGRVHGRALAITADLEYTLKDIEEFSKKIELGTPRIIGFYISTLINRIIKDTE